MRGIGRSSGAISIVNAIPAGIGCAVGVRLHLLAEAEVDRAGAPTVEVDPPTSSTAVVAAAGRAALAAVDAAHPYSLRLRIDSEVPVGRGLKSSSAVATAAIGAVFDAFGRSAPPEEIARLAAEAGRRAGVSATGAFDDALAGLVPGFVVTDNRVDRLLMRAPVDPAWVAIVHLPTDPHPPVPDLVERFRGEAAEGAAAADDARAGRWAAAMERNSDLVERAMGYDYAALRRAFRSAGAWASGVSGVGPALVALADRARAADVLARAPPARFAVPLASEAHP